MTGLLLNFAGVEPDLPDDHSGGVRMAEGQFTAREVQPLDYLHDPAFPGRVLRVEDHGPALRIVVNYQLGPDRFTAIGVPRRPNDPVRLSRLVDEHFTRDAEGVPAGGLS